MKSDQIPIHRVYLLSGDDTVGKEHARRKILQKIKDSHGQITPEKYDSSSEAFDNFIQRILTPSLFEETRVFQINHAQSLSDAEIKELNFLLQSPPPDSYLIIESDEEKRGKASTSRINKKLDIARRTKDGICSHLDFPKPPDYKIAAWLIEKVPQLFERKITKQDAEYLVELVGSDISLLYSELQKIDINLPPKKPVTHTSIEEIVGASRQMSVFELSAALAQKDLYRALTVVDSIFATSFYGPVMVSALFKKFWALFRIKRYAATNKDVIKKFLNSRGYNNPVQTETGYAIGLASGLLREGEQRKVYPVMILSGVVKQAQHFSENELSIILKLLLQFDTGIKTGRISGTQKDVQMLCYKIVRVSELSEDDIAA